MLAAILLTACSSESTSTGITAAAVEPAGEAPDLDLRAVDLGRGLYESLCAGCHGAAQDSTGQAWHHSDSLLVDLILHGSTFDRSRMPTFRDVLSESETLAIPEYLKSS